MRENNFKRRRHEKRITMRSAPKNADLIVFSFLSDFCEFEKKGRAGLSATSRNEYEGQCLTLTQKVEGQLIESKALSIKVFTLNGEVIQRIADHTVPIQE